MFIHCVEPSTHFFGVVFVGLWNLLKFVLYTHRMGRFAHATVTVALLQSVIDTAMKEIVLRVPTETEK